MSGLKTFVNKLANVGVKNNYQPWEILLTRKLNLSSFLGFINVVTGLILFSLIGYYDSLFEGLVVLCIAPFVFFLNLKFNYISAAYLFTAIGCFMFFMISVKTGPDAFAILYFFPFVLVLLQMLGRSETYHHLIFISIICLITFLAIIFSYQLNWFTVVILPELIASIKYVNLILSFFVALAFSFIVISEGNKQEKQLKTALQQKEVLLAELFHRVKNNLNLVTSLLNLKKNTISSLEAQEAIEECRNMVFSMALVHTKIYNSNNIDSLDFKNYLNDLVRELINSIGGNKNIEFEMDVPSININLTQAIPCGLIINEFITNSFKHGQEKDKKLKINLKLSEDDKTIMIELKDNGPGNMSQKQESQSLGLGLIKSLTEQLEGEGLFKNNNGLQFNLKFKKIDVTF
jgi:two-component sensor histidine kinase